MPRIHRREKRRMKRESMTVGLAVTGIAILLFNWQWIVVGLLGYVVLSAFASTASSAGFET